MLIQSEFEGLNTRVSPLNIKDTQFSQLRNVVAWHQSLSSKQGFSTLGKLTTAVTDATHSLDSSGNASISLTAPLSTTISISDGVNTWNSSSPPSNQLTANTAATGTINYATGAITLAGGVANANLTISYRYYAQLPVMGIATWTEAGIAAITAQGIKQLVFDQQRCYEFTGTVNSFQDILDSSIYVSSAKPCLWHGTDYQLFQFTQVAGSMFVSNQTPAMQLMAITAITINGTTVTVTTAQEHQLISSDYIWINEVDGITGLNGETFSSLTIVSPTQFSFTATATGTYTSGGILQYLTAQPNSSGDGLRYYYGTGFVNYAPPTSDQLQPDYICGCRTLLFLGGRLCLFGVYLATSQEVLAGTYRYLANTFFYSSVIAQELGSPYYTSLNPVGADYVNAGAFYPFPSGQYGGYFSFSSSTGISSAFLWKMQYAIVSFSQKDIYRIEITENPIFPFKAILLSNQYGGLGTNGCVALSELGIVVSKGGILGVETVTAARIDYVVPNQVGSISFLNNGFNRIICYVDNYLEAVFITFPSVNGTSDNSPFPDTTLYYNYRENTWALFDELFTCYGTLFSGYQGHTYGSLTKPWSAYNWRWDNKTIKGWSSVLNACGGTQGYLFNKDVESTQAGNDISLSINGIGFSSGYVILDIPNHNLVSGNYIYIDGCIGTWGDLLNGLNAFVFEVNSSSQIVVSFGESLAITGEETYYGLGVATVVDNFAIKTKDFSIGVEKALATKGTKVAVQVLQSNSGSFSLYATADTSTNNYNAPSQSYIPVGTAITTNSPDTSIGTNNARNTQEYMWKYKAINITGQSVGLFITKSPAQMFDTDNNDLYLSINAIMFELTPSGNLFQL